MRGAGRSGLELDLKENPHRRFNPLTREWILVSPNRTERPWLGQVEKSVANTPPAYDPNCYMCPGNARAAGAGNPDYKATFVFENDFPAVLADTPQHQLDRDGLMIARSESGVCRVLCFSPRHDLTISGMPLSGLRRVVDEWAQQCEELGARPDIEYVQIFENHGALMGASNPHPHCQIWATASVPNEPAKEQISQKEYQASHKTCMVCAYLELERKQADRIIFENSHFTALVPFWAIWPFETMVVPKRHLAAMLALTTEERNSLADILKRLTVRYDTLFHVSFPYSMGFHQCPTDGEPHSEWHLHAHFYPPLLRSATVRKFMVGFEMLGTPQRDLTPEAAAARLRAVEDR
jgi:UDPglucose--hexose-1-phosphate uridylyltransferase